MRAAGRFARHSRLVALLAMVTMTAACSGGDPAPPTTTRVPSVGPVAAISATPSPARLFVSPGELTSYRYTIALLVAGNAAGMASPGSTATAGDLSGAAFMIAIDGAVVNPDREHVRTTASLGFIQLALERIEIGDQAWTRQAGGDWKTATAGSPSSAITGELDISPRRIFAVDGSTFAALNTTLGELPFVDDQINGSDARRYDIDPVQTRALFGGSEGPLPGEPLPLDTQGSLWVDTATNVPVRIKLASTTEQGQPAFDLDLTLSDLNGGVGIEPPA